MSSVIVNLKRIRQLGSADKDIAEFILNNINIIPSIDIRDLAKKINYSPSGVTRFIKKIGYKNFVEFKYEIKKHVNFVNDEINTDKLSGYQQIIHRSLNLIVDELHKNEKLWLENESLNLLIDEIISANQVYIFAAGGNYVIARDLNLKLQRLGINCNCTNDPVIQETFLSINNGNENALFIVLSSSGETRTMVSISKKCKEKKLKLISVTGGITNTISKLSNLNIPIYFENLDFKRLYSGTRIPFILLNEIIIELLISKKGKEFITSLINTVK